MSDVEFLTEKFIENVAAKTAAKASAEFAEYLKNRRFRELFENRTGETAESIGAYRARDRAPAYTVKAGIGIPGSLNYLAGLYRGRAVSRSGKAFSYARPRDLLKGGWREWNGGARLREIFDAVVKRAGNEN